MFFLFAGVNYVPQEVVARPGENVTVYCVLKDRNASSANWSFNYQKWLDPSLYHPVSQQVRKVTVLDGGKNKIILGIN